MVRNGASRINSYETLVDIRADDRDCRRPVVAGNYFSSVAVFGLMKRREYFHGGRCGGIGFDILPSQFAVGVSLRFRLYFGPFKWWGYFRISGVKMFQKIGLWLCKHLDWHKRPTTKA